MLTWLTFMPALIRYFPSLPTSWLVMCNVHKYCSQFNSSTLNSLDLRASCCWLQSKNERRNKKIWKYQILRYNEYATMKIETRKLSRLEPWMHLAANCLGDDDELKLDFIFYFFLFWYQIKFCKISLTVWGSQTDLSVQTRNMHKGNKIILRLTKNATIKKVSFHNWCEFAVKISNVSNFGNSSDHNVGSTKLKLVRCLMKSGNYIVLMSNCPIRE